MNRTREIIFMGIGIFTGFALCGPAAHAATAITAALSDQPIYVDGQRVSMTAYSIGGNNYVKLRDIGQAVDFGVTYDASTNSVHIDTHAAYQEEVKQPAQTTSTPSDLSEENVQAIIRSLRNSYPHGAVYETPYRPNNPLNRPFTNCDHCAGWAMKCSDAAFGSLPWRQVDNPRWEDIRAGDVIVYKNGNSGHAIVVLERGPEFVTVTESSTDNKVMWSAQYPRWWLEEQQNYSIRTRYPQ